MKTVIPAKPEPLEIDVSRTGLVVIDMQNGFIKKGGMMDILGVLQEEPLKPVIEVNREVISHCRSKGIKVIYIRMTYKHDLSDTGGPESPNILKERAIRAMRENPQWKGKFLVEGTWDWEVIDDIKPCPGDVLVNKNRFSGFVITGLDAVLQTLNLKYLLFTGIFSNVCVESTIRDAFFHDYFNILISDGCCSSGPEFIQEATIYNVSRVFGWVTSSNELLNALP
jgi:ureidoacrylate peracid hydrolase